MSDPSLKSGVRGMCRVPGPLGCAPAGDDRLTEMDRKIHNAVSTVQLVPPSFDAPQPTDLNKRNTKPPFDDGEENLYIFNDLDPIKAKAYVDNLEKVRRDMDWSRRAIFINGMGNSGQDNKESSCVLSLLLMCPVISVYNRQDGFVGDLGQCVRDKLSFQVWPFNPKKAFEALAQQTGATTTEQRIKLMKSTLGTGRLGNMATATMFEVLAKGSGKEETIPIYAHSQGNLILSNALQAVKVVLGPKAIEGRQVYSYGSPAVTWPKEIEHYDHAFTFDLVSLLNFVPSWSISKVGWPDKTGNPITHGFAWYLQEDAAFIINRHRIGSFGVTVNMDEVGLAKELISFGVNEERLLRVFTRLDKHHNSDVDDVAVYYVKGMQQGGNKSRLKSMPRLVQELIRYMDEGWTSGEEKELIEFLKGL